MIGRTRYFPSLLPKVLDVTEAVFMYYWAPSSKGRSWGRCCSSKTTFVLFCPPPCPATSPWPPPPSPGPLGGALVPPPRDAASQQLLSAFTFSLIWRGWSYWHPKASNHQMNHFGVDVFIKCLAINEAKVDFRLFCFCFTEMVWYVRKSAVFDFKHSLQI